MSTPTVSFETIRRVYAPRLCLIWIPHAGGVPASVVPWTEGVRDDVEVRCAALPGRGRRLLETSFESVAAVVDALEHEFDASTCPPTVLFGHSLGALIAFEWARRGVARGKRTGLLRLLVSACPAPSSLPRPDGIWDLEQAQFLERIVEYGALPEHLLAEAELMDMMLPALRADFMMFETYTPRASEPLGIPITAFVGRDDRQVTARDVRGWAAETLEDFALECLPGDHFYMAQNRQVFVARLNQCLTHVLE